MCTAGVSFLTKIIQTVVKIRQKPRSIVCTHGRWIYKNYRMRQANQGYAHVLPLVLLVSEIQAKFADLKLLISAAVDTRFQGRVQTLQAFNKFTDGHISFLFQLSGLSISRRFDLTLKKWRTRIRGTTG